MFSRLNSMPIHALRIEMVRMMRSTVLQFFDPLTGEGSADEFQRCSDLIPASHYVVAERNRVERAVETIIGSRTQGENE